MKSKWLLPIERLSFEEGWTRASKGLSRQLQLSGLSYNERAAFADGWDCFHEEKQREARDLWKADAVTARLALAGCPCRCGWSSLGMVAVLLLRANAQTRRPVADRAGTRDARYRPSMSATGDVSFAPHVPGQRHGARLPAAA